MKFNVGEQLQVENVADKVERLAVVFAKSYREWCDLQRVCGETEEKMNEARRSWESAQKELREAVE